MSHTHRARAHARRSLALALASTSAAIATLGLVATPASAHPAGTWEINNYEHHAANTQEEGPFGGGSDEFYVLSINFQVQLGVADSFKVTRNTVYEIDDIDQGEDHAIEPRMGQAKFDITEWDPTRMIQLPWEDQEDPNRRGNKGPWIFGTFTQVMESDWAPWGAINGVHRGIAEAIEENLRTPLERATPTVIFGNLASQLLIDAIDPNNRELRDEILNNYLTGKVVNLAIDAVKGSKIRNLIGSILDDPVGPPTFSIVAGIENYEIPHPLQLFGFPPIRFAAADEFNALMNGLPELNAANSHVFALPERRRGIFGLFQGQRKLYTQRHSGSDATYDMRVRAAKL